MSRFQRWMEQILRLFTGNEADQESYTPSRSSDRKRYGRVLRDERRVESRVVHKYPKPGKFRFPVIDDEPKNIREEWEPSQKSSLIEVEVEESSTKGNSKRFDNPGFKPTHIPSPVHGFRSAPSKEEVSGTEEQTIPYGEDEAAHDAYEGGVVVPFRFLKKEEKKSGEVKPPPQRTYHEIDLKISVPTFMRAKKVGSPSLKKEDARDIAETEKSVESTKVDQHNRTFNDEREQEKNHRDKIASTLETENDAYTARETEVEGETLDAVIEERVDEKLDLALAEEVLPLEAKRGKESVSAMGENVEQEVQPLEIEEEPLGEEGTPIIEESFHEAAEENREQMVDESSKEETELPSTATMDQNSSTEAEVVPSMEGGLQEETLSESDKAFSLQGEEVEQVESTFQSGLLAEREPSAQQEEESDEREAHSSQEHDHTSASAKEREQEEENKSASEKGRQPRKRTVPFNVMMLPQDRAKQAHVAKRKEKEGPTSSYTFPSIQLLANPPKVEEDNEDWLTSQAELLEETLQSFNVDAKVVHVTKGPSVTRFEIQPARGVKVNKVTALVDDIKLSLAAKDIRIEAPIPGKNTIGIEVPNQMSKPVFLREILRRDVFRQSPSPLTVALGLDISGQPVVTDLNKMPHGLVAGATGSGKSVCINSILVSLLYKASPDEVKLMLIDPKMVELAPYNDLPHLVTPVITDAKQATAALKWVVGEMERRYELFSQQGVRDLARYNDLYSESPDKPALPYILVVIDELADLMMVSPQEVEDSICRIAQKARACGIHLLLATQRPSVDVITGLIKANIPTRVAFSVSSQTDSRTILDTNGAERLLGRGDMLFHANGSSKPIRVQGTFVSDEEIEDVIAHVKKQRPADYLLEQDQLIKVQEQFDQEDDLFEEACLFVIEQGAASASSLQRRFRIGYNRAARLIDMMEGQGVVSEAMGSKPRHVLMDEYEFQERMNTQD